MSQMKSHKRSPVIYDPISRRMFIKGMGAALAIPFLPSMAEAATVVNPKFVFLTMRHGRWAPSWYPLNPGLAAVQNQVAAKALSQISGPLGSVIGSQLDDLRGDISLIQGLDFLVPSVHDNFPWNASFRLDNKTWPYSEAPLFPYSADYILSQSNAVYTAAPAIRALRLSHGGTPGLGLSFSGAAANGIPIKSPYYGTTIAEAWAQVKNSISPSMPTTSTSTSTSVDKKKAKEQYLIDRFLNEYKAVSGSKDISSEDRPVLQNFIDFLTDLQKKIGFDSPVTTTSTTTTLPSTCASPSNTGETTDNDVYTRRLMDIMIAAMSCNATNIGMFDFELGYVEQFGIVGWDNGGYHTNIHNAEKQGIDGENITRYWSKSISHFGYMARKFKQLGLLDNMLMMFTSDMASSVGSHHGCDMPLLTAGSLDGKFRTGEMISYHRTNANGTYYGYVKQSDQYIAINEPMKLGRRWNEFLVTLFKAAGLSSAEWEKNGAGQGFGMYDCAASECSGKLTADALVTSMNNYYNSYSESKSAVLPYWYKG